MAVWSGRSVNDTGKLIIDTEMTWKSLSISGTDSIARITMHCMKGTALLNMYKYTASSYYTVSMRTTVQYTCMVAMPYIATCRDLLRGISSLLLHCGTFEKQLAKPFVDGQVRQRNPL